jgi:phosphoglycerate dehydrogenase-like enzyme
MARTSLPEVLVDMPLRHPGFEDELRGVATVRVVSPGPQGLLEESTAAEVLVCRGRDRIDGQVFDQHRNLRAVVCLGSGTDVVDERAAAQRGIEVIGTRGTGATAVAEHVMGGLIAVRRAFVPLDHHVREGAWEEARSAFVGSELTGSCLAVVGFGAIAREVVRIARAAFAMQVRVWAPRTAAQTILAAEALPVPDLTALLTGADALTLHVPLAESTRGLIGSAELSLLPTSAVVVNAARGGIVDEQALAAMLIAGQLAGAVIDVTRPEPPPASHPLLTAPNVLLTPHTAGLTAEADARRHRRAAQIVARILSTEQKALP